MEQKSEAGGQIQADIPPENRVKTRVNPWMVSTIILGFLLLFLTGVKVLSIFPKDNRDDDILPSPEPTVPIVKTVTSFNGIVLLGEAIPEKKEYCSEGVYLKAEEGQFLANNKSSLMLIMPNLNDERVLIDPVFIGKKVEVLGKYPAQENFCEAMICQCEDYILVENIKLLNITSEATNKTVEGEIVCLPNKNRSGPQTLECTFGLLGDDGGYYGLEDLNQQDIISGRINTGNRVTVTGIFIEDTTSTYDIIGTIKVTSVEFP